MTCIAVSITHGCLAADSRVSTDGSMWGVNKAKRIGRSLVAAAGDWDDVLKFWELIEKKKKNVGLTDDSEVEGIELSPTGIYLYSSSGKRYPIRDAFFAIGSGAPYALGAMAMGANPEEAVQIASKFDPATGGSIDVLQLKVARNDSKGQR